MIYGTTAKVVERLSAMREILEIQDAITKAARKSLEKQGFLEIIPPVLAFATDPGLRGAKQFEVDYYGKRYKLTSSMMLHKIAAASALGRVFSLSPCLRKERLEAAETGRHLAEFWQIDVEMQGTKEGAMKSAETMLRDVIRDVVRTKGAELEKLDRKIKTPALPLKRLKHSKMVELAKELGFEADEKGEIPWEAEKAISLEVGEPFFIVDYPVGSRGFYDKTVSRTQLGFDLIYPGGFGEAVSGSEREMDSEMAKEKLRGLGEDPERYAWFTELLEKGIIKQTAGFGFGLERLTRYICGLDRIEEATPFPKLPGGEGI